MTNPLYRVALPIWFPLAEEPLPYEVNAAALGLRIDEVASEVWACHGAWPEAIRLWLTPPHLATLLREYTIQTYAAAAVSVPRVVFWNTLWGQMRVQPAPMVVEGIQIGEGAVFDDFDARATGRTVGLGFGGTGDEAAVH